MKMTSASSLSFLIFASVICLIRGQYGFGPYGMPGFGMFGPPMPGFGPRSSYFPPMYGSGSSPPMSYFPSPGFGGRRSGFSPYPPIPPTAFPPPGFPPSPFMSPFVPPFSSPGLPPSFVSGSGPGPSPFGSFASSSRPTFQVTRLDGKNIGSEGPSSVIDGISDSDLVAEATGRKKYIYGFKGNKYYFGKPWDVFSR